MFICYVVVYIVSMRLLQPIIYKYWVMQEISVVVPTEVAVGRAIISEGLPTLSIIITASERCNKTWQSLVSTLVFTVAISTLALISCHNKHILHQEYYQVWLNETHLSLEIIKLFLQINISKS